MNKRASTATGRAVRKKKKDASEVARAEKIRYFRGLLKINWEMSHELRKLLHPPYGPHPEESQQQIMRMWGVYLGELIWDVHGAALSASFDDVHVSADILIRALFEYLIKLHYLHGHPEEAEFQYDRGHFESLKANPERLNEAHNQAHWERLQPLFATNPRRAKSVEEMSRYFEERSEDGTLPGKLYDAAYRTSSQLVHGTARGLEMIWNAPKVRKELGLWRMFFRLSEVGRYLATSGWIVAGLLGKTQKPWGKYLDKLDKVDDRCERSLTEKYDKRRSDNRTHHVSSSGITVAPLAILRGHRSSLTSVTWSPTSALLASAAGDNTVRLWQSDGKQVETIATDDEVVSDLAWSPDGSVLAMARGDSSIALWRGRDRSSTYLHDHTAPVRCISWSPDGTILASGSYDKTIRLWQANGNRSTILDELPHYAMDLAWSPDGRLLAIAAFNGLVQLMSADREIVVTLQPGAENQAIATGVAWSPTGKVIAFSSIDKFVHLHTASGQPVAVLKGHAHWVGGVDWSPKGSLLASHSSDKAIRLWRAESGNEESGPWVSVQRLKGHKLSVECLAWSPDGKILASGGEDETVRLWAVSQ